MKKIENIFNENILDMSKKDLSNQKKYNSLAFGNFILVILLLVMSVVNLFLNPLGAISEICSVLFLAGSSFFLKMTTKKANQTICKRIISCASHYQDKTEVEPNATIEIVPTNIRVGENLEASNAIPIFKEGHYVIVKSKMKPYFIRVVEDENGVKEEFLMESTPKDIKTLMDEVPKYEEYIKILSLENSEMG